MLRAFVIFLTATLGTVRGQDISDRQQELTRLAEDLVGTPEDDAAFESSYEGLVQILSKPVNLNHANIEELLALGFLSNEQAQSIVAYRSKNGAFLSFYELQAVPGLPLDVIERLRPFVIVLDRAAAIDRTLVKRIVQESDNYLIARLSRAWNDRAEATPYTGSPEHLLMRFRSQRPGDFSFGFNTEKDEGEPIRWDVHQRYYGFDRWSFHAQLQNKGLIRNLVIGDFQAQYGQGLTLGGAFGPGKGAETIITMRRVNVGIVPYTSAYESGNMRGFGLALALPRKLELTLFSSRVSRDASIGFLNAASVVTSLQQSGLHRTEKELAGKHQVSDTQAGCVLQRRQGPLELGIIFAHSYFDLPIQPGPTPYNQFALRGRTLSNTGFFFNYNTGRFATFGEVGVAIGKGTGVVAGALASITSRLDIAVLIRNYEPDFHARFSNAVSENSTATNERGAYVGWRYQFSRRVALTAYLDLFTFPWLRYRAYAPSAGYEWLWRFSYQPTRNVLLYLQAREESKSRNASADQPAYSQISGTKNNYWVHAEVGLRDHLRFRTKFQMSRFVQGHVVTHGMAVSQDLRIGWNRWEFVARYALFDTDNYDNRLYSYENDVLFAYSMPAYNGTGIRKMIMTRIDIMRNVTAWVRYAETVTTHPEGLSPGYSEAHYAFDREVRFQLRIQF